VNAWHDLTRASIAATDARLDFERELKRTFPIGAMVEYEYDPMPELDPDARRLELRSGYVWGYVGVCVLVRLAGPRDTRRGDTVRWREVVACHPPQIEGGAS